MSANCEEISLLEKVPLKVLLKIGTFLSCNEMINLSTTSKLMNTRISENPTLLSKMPLWLTTANTKNFQEARKALTRSYSEVYIKHSKFTKNIALWLTSNFCSKLTNLEMAGVTFNFSDYKLIRKTFQSLHHVERMVFFAAELEDFDQTVFSQVEPVEMVNLQNIQLLSDSSVELLLFMKTPNLKSLKIASPIKSLNLALDIISFLGNPSLEKLEKLVLWNIDFEDNALKLEDIQKIKSPLRNLSLRHLKAPFHKDEYFMEFLGKVADTLEELDICEFDSVIPKDVYLMIFSKLPNVKTLRLFPEEAPKEYHFYERELVVNTAITKLIIESTDDAKYLKQFSGFLSKLPNLETLILPCAVTKQVLVSVRKNCLKLKTLNVTTLLVSEKAFGRICLPSVRELRICNLIKLNTDKCNKFVKVFPNLESVAIHECDKSVTSEGVLKILTTTLKLKHVTFGAGFRANERIFNQLGKCKELQSVEILQKAFENLTIATKIKSDFQKLGLRFICYAGDELCNRFDFNYGSHFWSSYSELDGGDEWEDVDELFGVDLFARVVGFLLNMIQLRATNDDDSDSDDSSEIEYNHQNQLSVMAEELD